MRNADSDKENSGSCDVKKSKLVVESDYGEDNADSPSLESVQRELKKEDNEIEELPEQKNNAQKSSSSMYNHLRSLEIEDKVRPLPNYIENVQNDISPKMRETLVDWLVEVLEEYKLVPETLYLAVSYVDRFLSSHALSRNKLQLLGVCCMLIASKFEDINSPHVEDFCAITDNTYMKEEVVEMEKRVIKSLNFEMSGPTTKWFLRIFTRVAHEDDQRPYLQSGFLSCYLAELTLLDYGCLRYLPSQVAASTVFVSRFIMQPEIHPWSRELQSFTGYQPTDLRECVHAIQELHIKRRANSSRAIRDKYRQQKCHHVASLACPPTVPERYFEALDE